MPAQSAQQQLEASKCLSDAMAVLADQLKAGQEDKSKSDDRSNAIIGLKMDQTMPTLKDSDVDFENHWRQFTSIMDMHSFGKRNVRRIDQLVAFGVSLQAGGTRRRIYDKAMKEAQHEKRLPEKAGVAMATVSDKSGSGFHPPAWLTVRLAVPANVSTDPVAEATNPADPPT